MQRVISVFDSGVGGMTTAAEIQRMLPDAKIIYFGDSEHCPYGERTQGDLVHITADIVADLQKQGAEVIVIACNTATTQCIRFLREKFPDLTFIGTEPAIKVACDLGCENILLMATPSTIKSAQVQKLIQRYIASQEVTLLPCPGLAELVEKSVVNGVLQDTPELAGLLSNLLGKVADHEKIDAVVLGCTHYIYLKSEIQKLFPNAELVDGNLGVAKRVKEVIGG